MKRSIAKILAALVASAAIAPVARATELVAPALDPSTRLASIAGNVSAGSLSQVDLVPAAAAADIGAGRGNISTRTLELERVSQGIELEICHHERVFAYVDSTTYTFFTCRP